MHLVDTVEVEPERVEDYLEVIGTPGMAVMGDAGASFVSCATTCDAIGEAVCIEVRWSFDDHVQWDEIRKNLVLDPRYHQYGATVASLRVRGTRRFFTLTTPSQP
ncbi:MAG TPA: hypothetical protein VMU64_02575 [Acidimicrobiales bacterium]|nr:hypothetical protein [Acidimicrobiales bacterium]